ncbi:MAG: hypothetical protein HY319_20575 [Armatimonadetes bacterium]|nr:hypothetical protein [Armatimonadota bacterium]
MISAVANKLTHWVRQNVSGSGEEAKDFSTNPRATQIDKEYGRIQDGLQQVAVELDKIDEETKLRPPALKNIKDMELVMMGGAAGAAIGGGIGLVSGLIDSAAGAPEVTINKVETPIFRQSLARPQGWTMVETEVNKPVPLYDGNGNQVGTTNELQGWQRTYTPSVNQERVGSYTVEQPDVKQTATGSPLTSGLAGAAIGGGIGALVGAGVVVARKVTGKGAYEESDRRNVEGQVQLLVKTGAAGAVAGAGVGFLSAALEAGHSDTIKYTVESPVMKTEVIGRIPQDHTVSALAPNSGTPAERAIEVQNPEMRLGITGRSPKVESETRTLDVEGRFGYVGGIVGGAVVGGIAGVATGVLINTLRKSI